MSTRRQLQTMFKGGEDYAGGSRPSTFSTPSATPPTQIAAVASVQKQGEAEQIVSDQCAIAIQSYMEKSSGLNENVRNDKVNLQGGRVEKFGSNIAILDLFVRKYIPWIALTVPYIREYPALFNHIAGVLTGNLIKKNGVILNSDFRQAWGFPNGARSAPAGSRLANNMKNLSDYAIKLFNAFKSEMINCSKYGVAAYSEYSLCVGVEQGASELVANDRRERFLNSYGVDKFDMELKKLVFKDNAFGKVSVFTQYLDLLQVIGEYDEETTFPADTNIFDVDIEDMNDLYLATYNSTRGKELLKHPVYYIIGLLCSLDRVFGTRTKHFCNFVDLDSLKSYRQCFSQHVESSLMFWSFLIMFYPDTEVSNHSAFTYLITEEFPALWDQCKRHTELTRALWFNAKNMRVIQLALELFSCLPRKNVLKDGGTAFSSGNYASAVTSSVPDGVITFDDEDEHEESMHVTKVPSANAVGSSRPKRPKATISASVTQQEEKDLNDQDLLNEFGDGTPPSGEETPEESDTGDDEEERDERRTKNDESPAKRTRGNTGLTSPAAKKPRKKPTFPPKGAAGGTRGAKGAK